MASACLRLVTFLPLRPDFSLPRLNSCISRSTSLLADGEYFRPDDFFDEDFFDEDFEADLRLPDDFRLLDDFLAELFFALLREPELFFAEDFLAEDFFELDFFELLDFFFAAFFVAMNYPPST